MWDGTVDEEWSKQHHSVWHEREIAKGNIATPPPEGKVQPAE
jgi:cytochrome b subunit of formate dehydrogenase